MCNTYCFSTAAVVARTRLGITFIRKLHVFSVYVNMLENQNVCFGFAG